ncbi:MAG TPA: hypothetical protein VHK89_08505, partial [Actinomycetota bacterium]|nr:hypothetical protein [Actinomycetota bacterium]
LVEPAPVDPALATPSGDVPQPAAVSERPRGRWGDRGGNNGAQTSTNVLRRGGGGAQAGDEGD